MDSQERPSSQEGRENKPLVGDTRSIHSCPRLSDGTKSLIRLLFVLALERSAFYSVFMTIADFSENYLQFSSTSSTVTNFVFSGSVFLVAPLFGILTDRKTGYIPTLVGALTFYVTGSCLLIYAAARTVSGNTRETTDMSLRSVTAVYFTGIAVISLSASAVRSGLLPFMVEQLSDGHAKRNTLMAFCSWAYLLINVAATVTLIPSSYIWEYRGFKKSRGVYSSGFVWLYLMSLCYLLLCLAILVIWKNSYNDRQLRTHSVAVPSILDIMRTACGCYRDSARPLYYDPDALPVRNEEDRIQYDRGIERKKLAVLVPVLATMIIYFASYTQLRSSFREQGEHLFIGTGTVKEQSSNCSSLPRHVSFLTSPAVTDTFGGVSVVVVLLAMPTIIRPLYEKYSNKELTIMTRIHWGMIFSLLASMCATILEAVRFHRSSFNVQCVRIGVTYHLRVYSSLSIFWQIPQYSLMGISTALAAVAAMEFVLSRAPGRFRCTAFGCFWVTVGIGNYIGLFVYSTMKKLGLYFTSPEITEGQRRVDKSDLTQTSRAWAFYLIFTVLLTGNLIVFVWIKYRHRDIQKVERDEPYTMASPI
ncbi:solute carrier family 15 member 4-like [Corticium candelabrum]|uniref:solute carrier family 15 member 4-like n=1 Tax=Corticium candelabrum TaxID=121492 RepID=UPI002E36FF9D|nr:solute carrier family 15 member 4-like [Corticium candelabrum]